MSEITLALHALIYHSNHKVRNKMIVDSDLIKRVFKNFSLCEKGFIKSFLPPIQSWFHFLELEQYKILIKMDTEMTVLMAVSSLQAISNNLDS